MRADASTGESFGTSSGAPHGRIGAVRFTPAYDSHDLADATSRDGLSAPRFRASSPTMCGGRLRRLSRADGGSRPGNRNRRRRTGTTAGASATPTSPGLTSCGIGSTSIATGVFGVVEIGARHRAVRRAEIDARR